MLWCCSGGRDVIVRCAGRDRRVALQALLEGVHHEPHRRAHPARRSVDVGLLHVPLPLISRVNRMPSGAAPVVACGGSSNRVVGSTSAPGLRAVVWPSTVESAARRPGSAFPGSNGSTIETSLAGPQRRSSPSPSTPTGAAMHSGRRSSCRDHAVRGTAWRSQTNLQDTRRHS